MRAPALLALAGLLFLAGCGGGGGGSSAPPVSVRSTAVTLSGGETRALRDAVTAAQGETLVWSVVDAGSVTPEGVYTAPAAPGTYHVRVWAQSSPDRPATLTIVVQAGGADVTVPFPGSGDTGVTVPFPGSGDLPVHVN